MLKSRYSNYNLECGIDEAGRGCLAGPVTAAAVILKANFKHDLIDDSKKLSKIKREELSKIIKENSIAYSIQFVDSRSTGSASQFIRGPSPAWCRRGR